MHRAIYPLDMHRANEKSRVYSKLGPRSDMLPGPWEARNIWLVATATKLCAVLGKSAA